MRGGWFVGLVWLLPGAGLPCSMPGCAVQTHGSAACSRARPPYQPPHLPHQPSCLSLADSELYWFVCFNAPAELSAAASPEAWRQEALDVVRGWAWGLPEAVEATPAEDLSRSRLVDRWAGVGRAA